MPSEETLAAARKVFDESGISVADWARANRFSTGLVYQVLEGKRKCLRGQSHQIAVALGLKPAGVSSFEELEREIRRLASIEGV